MWCVVGIFVGKFILHKDISYAPFIVVLAAGSLLTFLAWKVGARRRQITDGFLARQLLLDAVILVSLVWFSGRSANPFIYYLLVIIAISANIFPTRILWAFSLGGIGTYTFLMYFDLNTHILHMPHDFQLHMLGMWLNFVGSAVLISFFISRLTKALRDREIQLADIREQTLKNEQLIGIGTLAASTVHSLGTPLSTIAISLGELKSENKREENGIYFDLIQTQIDRCKHIMRKLALLANNNPEENTAYTLSELLEDIREYFLLINADPCPGIEVEKTITTCVLPGSLLLKHALINLIDNAIQAAKNVVNVKISLENKKLFVSIEDDGDGIPENLVDSLGKPTASSKEDGMGIGIFLANSTIEKLDGKVQFFGAKEEYDKRTTKVLVEIPIQKEPA